YLIAIPGADLRSRVLADSGHAYWLWAVQAAIGLAALGLGAMAIRQLRAGSGSADAGPPSRLVLAGRLALGQVTMFVTVEAAERLAVGEPLGRMFHYHVLWLGLVVQCLVAVAGAWFLRWFHRTVERIAAWVRGPHARHVAALFTP